MILASLFWGVISSIIFKGVESTGKKLVSESIDTQLKVCAQTSIDKLSEKYPVIKTLDGYSFWDFICAKLNEDLNPELAAEAKIKAIFCEALNSLYPGGFDAHGGVDQICSYFFEQLKMQIVSRQELYRLFLLNYSQSFHEDIFNISAKIDEIRSLLAVSSIIDFDSDQFREAVFEYFLALQQDWFLETNGEYFDRVFQSMTTQQGDEEIVEFTMEAIAYDNTSYIILGEPGSGKTSLLKYAMASIAMDKSENMVSKLPIYLRLSLYGIYYSNILDGIQKVLQAYIEQLDIESISALMRNGKVILLLDGLDEVKDDFYESCVEDIRSMLIHYPQNKYLVTGRENAYCDEFSGRMETVRLTLLSEMQVLETIEERCGLDMFQIGHDDLKLLSNPLLLQIAIRVIKENGGRIPQNRCVLLNEFCDFLISKWERQKGLKRKHAISYINTIALLGEIAFWGLDKPYVSKDRIYKIACGKHSDMDSIYDYLMELGFFKRTSDSEINFFHKTFLDYFAARHVISKLEETSEFHVLDAIIPKKNWSDVFVYVAGLLTEWALQDSYLNYILVKSFKLYIDCLSEKNNLSKELFDLDFKDYEKRYFETFVVSYEKIINTYFSQVKHLFYPYLGYRGSVSEAQIYVLAQMSEDRQRIYYVLEIGPESELKVKLATDFEFEQHRNHWQENRSVFESSSVNLNISGLVGDTARIVSLKRVKAEVKRILDKNLLAESNHMLCERVLDAISKLPIKDLRTTEDIYIWLDKQIKDMKAEFGGDIKGYLHNRIDLLNLFSLVGSLYNTGIDLESFALPRGDINEPSGGFIWSCYSQVRLLERIRSFFRFYKDSFTYVLKNNFDAIKEYLPDYANLPYKYVAEVVFNDREGFYSEPSLCYSRIACSESDEGPVVTAVKSESIWGQHGYSFCNTGVTMVMIDNRRGSNLPLCSNVYELVKQNMEYLLRSV